MSCEMIKIQSELLEGDALRWAVMKAEGLELHPIFKEGQFSVWFTPDDGSSTLRARLIMPVPRA